MTVTAAEGSPQQDDRFSFFLSLFLPALRVPSEVEGQSLPASQGGGKGSIDLIVGTDGICPYGEEEEEEEEMQLASRNAQVHSFH